MTRPAADKPTVAIASNNRGKISELRQMLGPGFAILTLEALGLQSPEETGSTFADNALLKAQFVHAATGLLALADDSGLEVDALGGAPGIYSARYAGDPPDDAANRRRLLDVLSGVPPAQRNARFVCAIAVIDQQGHSFTTRGTCDGVITLEERGSGGFGYDSLFELPDGMTMAELSAEEKNRMSHRAVAMRLALPVLRKALGIALPNSETVAP